MQTVLALEDSTFGDCHIKHSLPCPVCSRLKAIATVLCTPFLWRPAIDHALDCCKRILRTGTETRGLLFHHDKWRHSPPQQWTSCQTVVYTWYLISLLAKRCLLWQFFYTVCVRARVCGFVCACVCAVCVWCESVCVRAERGLQVCQVFWCDFFCLCMQLTIRTVTVILIS